MEIRSMHFLFVLGCLFIQACAWAVTDPLPSWNEGPIKSGIIQFVKETTTKGEKNYVPPEERIATFDQDGTLWVEQPLYTQFLFAIDRVKILAPEHPEWKDQEPFKSILHTPAGEVPSFKGLPNHNMKNIELILAITHSGMTVDEFHDMICQWLKVTVHPRFKKPFTDLVYQPMLEVLQFFEDNDFKNYIVSGGGQEFMRCYADRVYHVPPERVIGTANKVKYEYRNEQPILLKTPKLLFVDDLKGKPESINLFIGRRPVASFGNSDGDRQMLEWTQAGKGKNFELLVHHDDAVREYAYDNDSKVGTFSASLMEEAKKRGWFVVSMKNDWKVIFPWEKDKRQ